jgi:hypothetical protein
MKKHRKSFGIVSVTIVGDAWNAGQFLGHQTRNRRAAIVKWSTPSSIATGMQAMMKGSAIGIREGGFHLGNKVDQNRMLGPGSDHCQLDSRSTKANASLFTQCRTAGRNSGEQPQRSDASEQGTLELPHP